LRLKFCDARGLNFAGAVNHLRRLGAYAINDLIDVLNDFFRNLYDPITRANSIRKLGLQVPNVSL